MNISNEKFTVYKDGSRIATGEDAGSVNKFAAGLLGSGDIEVYEYISGNPNNKSSYEKKEISI